MKAALQQGMLKRLSENLFFEISQQALLKGTLEFL